MLSAKSNKSVSFNLSNPYQDPRKKSQNSSVTRTEKPPPKFVSLDIKDLSLESSIVLLDTLKKLPGYIEKTFKDALYVGVMVDDIRHGLGIMKYRNGR
jgi:hypothetical protein